MDKIIFDKLPDGTVTEQYTLHNGEIKCEILTYGGTLKSLTLPDKNGKPVDVLLGFDSIDGYLEQSGFVGAQIGRYANRIGGSSFEIEGKSYPICTNDGNNHLHGGKCGFDKQVWQVKSACDTALELELFSPDGQEGYPGNLKANVLYTLTDNALRIDWMASCDKDTLCNLTSHAYFNLSGHNFGTVEDQYIQIFADCYTPTDSESITTGEIAAVENTPMDLRKPIKIGKYADSGFEQLKWAGGYDHNWCINGENGVLRPAATAKSEQTGIIMNTYTTQPGMQFYSGNYIHDFPKGKGGAEYVKRSGFCLETQSYPDSPHHSNFPSAVLKAGETYRHTTIYEFKVEK